MRTACHSRRDAAALGADEQAVLPGQVPGELRTMGGGDGQQSQPPQGPQETLWKWSVGTTARSFWASSVPRQAGKAASLSAHRGPMGIRLLWSTKKYCFGDDETQLGKYAWYSATSGSITTHPVGQKKPNAWGLYDMHGNVWEWCQDWYDEDYYVLSPADDPVGPSGGSCRVHRGGMWSNSPVGCRAAYRTYDLPAWCDLRLGLRVAQLPADNPVPASNSAPADNSVHLFFAGRSDPAGCAFITTRMPFSTTETTSLSRRSAWPVPR